MARPTLPEGAPVQPYAFLSDEEKQLICEQVAECGNLAEAARRVVGERRVSAVHAAARNDLLTFGASIEAAKGRHVQSIRDEIRRRAFGYEKELTYQGVRTGDRITEVSDNLLLAYARMFDPLYTDRKTVGDLHLVGEVTVAEAQPGLWSISDQEAMALPESGPDGNLKAQLANVLKYLIRHRRELGREQRNFEALTDQRGAVDVEFAEVSDDDAELQRQLAEIF